MPTNKPKSTAGAVTTISQSELQEKYPFFKPLQTSNLSQDQLREYAELLDNVMMASDLNKEALVIEKQHFEPGRKKMSTLVAKIYALYLSVEASTQKREIYEEYRGVLETNYKVTVHEDTPRSALVMKIVLPKIDSKTAHLYGRALDLAKGYEVDPSDYVGFVKGLGGYEKIRKAYAKVLAADAGKMLPLQKYAADSATRAFVSGLEPVKYTSASI